MLGPLLLGIPSGLLNEFRNYELPYFEKLNKELSNQLAHQELNTNSDGFSNSSQTTKIQSDESWKDLPPHKDENQVLLDTDRSFFYYPCFPLDEKDVRLPTLKNELSDVIFAVLRRNPHLCYYQGYHDIAAIFYLVFGAQEAIPILEYVTLKFLRDFMMPSLDPSLEHHKLIPTLLPVAFPDIAEALSEAKPFYAISAVISILTHDMTSFEHICTILDFVFTTNNMAAPLYLYISILNYQKSKLISTSNEFNENLEGILPYIIKNLPNDKSLTFDIISLASNLLEMYPPQTLDCWDEISPFSVLRTSAAPPKLNDSCDFDSYEDTHSIQDRPSLGLNEGIAKLSNIEKSLDLRSLEFDELCDESHSYLEFPNSSTLPAEPASFQYENYAVSAKSKRDSGTSLNFMQSLKNITLPVSDRRIDEYLQIGDYTNPSFSQSQENLLSPKSAYSLGCSVGTQEFDRPTTVDSSGSMSSLASSTSDMALDSRGTTAIGSFTSAKSPIENDCTLIPNHSIMKITHNDCDSNLESTDTDVDEDDCHNADRFIAGFSSATNVNRGTRKLVAGLSPDDFMTTSCLSSFDEPHQTSIETKTPNEGKLATEISETEYSLNELKELLTKQLEQYNEMKMAQEKREMERREMLAEKKRELVRKENEEISKQEAEKQRRLQLTTLIESISIKITVPANGFDIFSFSSSSIYNRFSTIRGNRIFPPYFTSSLPKIWTESTSLAGRLVQLSGNSDKQLNSSLETLLDNTIEDECLYNELKRSPGYEIPQLGVPPFANMRATSLLKIDSKLSVSFYIGLLGLLAAWYVNHHGVSGIKTLFDSSLQQTLDLLHNQGIKISYQI